MARSPTLSQSASDRPRLRIVPYRVTGKVTSYSAAKTARSQPWLSVTAATCYSPGSKAKTLRRWSTRSSSRPISYPENSTNHSLGIVAKSWQITNASPWTRISRSTSVIQRVLGSVAPTKIPMACSASTSPREWTCRTFIRTG